MPVGTLPTVDDLTRRAVAELGRQRLLPAQLEAHLAAVAAALVPGVEVLVVPVDLVRRPRLPVVDARLPRVLRARLLRRVRVALLLLGRHGLGGRARRRGR